MPSLLTIPTEILQNIIDQVNLDDLISFSVCCKGLYGVAQRRLGKHREQIKTYSELQYSDCFRNEADNHPIKILREICRDDQIAFYPRSLKITCCDYLEDVKEPDNDEDLSKKELLTKEMIGEFVREVFDEFKSAIDEKLSRALCYNDKNIEEWRHRLKRGTRRGVLCLLLLLLPNLEILHLIHFGFEEDILEDMLDLIAKGSHGPDVTFGPLALTKLSKVFLGGSDIEGGRCRILPPLAVLPSVRTITASCVDGDLNWPYEQHMSGVTVLNFQSSILSGTSLSRLLGGINALKSFTYNICSRESDYCEPVDSIIGMLLEHAKASLESVAFIGPWDLLRYHQRGSCSFKGFEVLREIQIDLGCYLKDEEEYRWSNDGEIFDDWYDKIERLVDLLPASVRSIKLHGTIDIADMSLLLKELPERKAKCVPHLKSVKFMDSHIMDSHIMDSHIMDSHIMDSHMDPYILCEEDDANSAWAHTWWEECQKVGIRLSL